MLVVYRTFPGSCARALACIGRDLRVRLGHAVGLGITERRAYGIVADLAEAGWVVKRVRRVWSERGWWQ